MTPVSKAMSDSGVTYTWVRWRGFCTEELDTMEDAICMALAQLDDGYAWPKCITDSNGKLLMLGPAIAKETRW